MNKERDATDGRVGCSTGNALRREPAGNVDTRHIQTAAALELLRAWDRWRGTQLLPSRADMRMEEIVKLLPNVVLLEVRGPRDIVYRLVGTEISAAIGIELTGRSFLEAAPPEARALRAARINHVVSRPCAAVMHGTQLAVSGLAFAVESIVLPVRPAEAGAPMQALGLVALLPGATPPSQVSEAEAGRLAETYRFVDIGAGVPADG